MKNTHTHTNPFLTSATHRSRCQDGTIAPVDERVLTVEDLTHMFNVSAKTISRWRQHGLNGQRVVIDGHNRVGFRQSAVERFVRENPQRIRRGARFRHVTEEERREIIALASQRAGDGGTPSDIIKQIAEKMDRSAETIRYTIKRFDEQHPDHAVLANVSGPMSEELKQRIYQLHCRDASIEDLAERFGRPESEIRDSIKEMRAQRLMELPLEYMASEEFDRADAEAEILAPMPQPKRAPRKARAPSGLSPYLARLYEVPLLTKEQEVHLFRKYNYLKRQAGLLRDQLDPARPQVSLMDQLEKVYGQAVETKNQLIRANLRLVVSIAKKYAQQSDKFYDLVSDGNISLMKAVEKFDYTLGFKFSTYASWAIKKNYARVYSVEMRQLDRFRNTQDELLDSAAELRPDPYQQEIVQERHESKVKKILDCLDDREQRIIAQRYGLNGWLRSSTLKEIGEDLGVSKERIRQLESRALNKLREAAAAENVESPF